jgi:flagellar protein FlaG
VATVNPSPPAVISASSSGVAAPPQDVKAVVSVPSQSVEKPAPALQEVREAAQQIETYLKSIGRNLEFRVDENSGRTVITVKDSTTGEVIRQIPGDESLRLARSLDSHALVDLAV